ncbi:RDD family protein [Colwellia sp. E2M01]|uniref:RDD family protein n=1 Tax=Colwellia sp. E2M01 TaxID=2841561 RepID=UPI001C08C9F2|nr:RDD family protein [Colwellia sp. E2M01]MBU2870650.1 RDD family protein [Colwellia sp. E2M01]
MTDTNTNSTTASADNTEADHEIFPRAGFRRRIGSWVYDFLLACAVYMTAGAIGFLLLYLGHYFGLFGMQGYQHFSDTISNTFWLKWPNELWKLFWVSYFFVFFWTKSGQTLGMRAWRLRVQNIDGSLISKKTAVKRLLPTLFGLGNIIVIFDRKNKLSLQDRLTKTEVVRLSLEANRGRL